LIRELAILAALVQGPPAREVTLAEALAAIAASPARRSASARTAASTAEVDAAGGWPRPSVGVATTRATARVIASATLPLPIFGTLAAEVGEARAGLGVARAEEGGTGLELRRRVASSWIELARLDERAALAREAAARAADLERVASERFAAGDAARAEVVAASAAAARARAHRDASRIAAEAASADLAGELGWDPTRRLQAAGGLPPLVEPPPLATLRARARAHPEVGAAAARADVEGARFTHARRARLPGLAVEGEADVDDGTLPGNDYRVGVILEVPLFDGSVAAARAAEARWRAARAEREAVLRSVDAAVVAAYGRYRAAAERARPLHEEVLPGQHEAADLARAAYREGQVQVSAVLEAERSLLDVEGEALDAQADAAVARADLEWAAGGPW
jgi:outer membrane protein TolC